MMPSVSTISPASSSTAMSSISSSSSPTSPRLSAAERSRRRKLLLQSKPRTANLIILEDCEDRTNLALNLIRLSSDLAQDLFQSQELERKVIALCAIADLVVSKDHSRWKLFSCVLDPDLSAATVAISRAAAGGLLDRSTVVLRSLVKAPKLTQVVIAINPELHKHMLKSAVESNIGNLGGMTRVIGQGDIIAGGIVQACEPCRQGLLVEGVTKFTFVKYADLSKHYDNDQASVLEDDLDNEIARFLDLTTSSLSISVETSLLEARLPDQLLVPPPSRPNDSESYGFVGLHILAQLGVFSGEWVNLVAGNIKRPIKIYAYPLTSSFDAQKLSLSPILFYNLEQPCTVQLCRRQTKEIHCAKEITINRINSAQSTERSLQTAYMQGLRSYFEGHRRVVAQDDIIAIPIDETLARLMYSPDGSSNKDISGYDSIISSVSPSSIVWFRVAEIIPPDNWQPTLDEESSRCAFIIDSTQTRVIQNGSLALPPPSNTIPWAKYYSLPLMPQFSSPSALRLSQLLRVCVSPAGLSLKTAILVYSSKRGVGKAALIRSVATEIGLHVFEIDAYEIISESDVKTLGFLKARLERAATCSPYCLVVVRHIDAIAKKSDRSGSSDGMADSRMGDKFATMVHQLMNLNPGMVFLATTYDAGAVSDRVRGLFKFEIEVGTPSEAERKQIFEFVIASSGTPAFVTAMSGVSPISKNPSEIVDFRIPRAFNLSADVKVGDLALQSAGLVPADLISICKSACSLALDRLKLKSQELSCSLYDVILADGYGYLTVTSDDFKDAISSARIMYSDSIGAPRIPSVQWEDVGGLSEVKSEILDTIEMPLKYPSLFSGGVKKRSGILFYGPPGTGKTLLAKAIATSFSLNFFSIKGPELLNMYIGESEANVRKVFQRARDARPCVVFFDELDSVAPKRGNQGDSGGVMDRIVSQLLAELDGMSNGGSNADGVFVVGATNRPDLLDEALLRPGRFDKMLYLGVSDTHEKQLNILKALTRKFTLSPDLDLRLVARSCPFVYTGADFYALCSDAMLNAMTRLAKTIDEKVDSYNQAHSNGGDGSDDWHPRSLRWWFETQATPDDVKVIVALEDFVKAQNELVASVSEDELRHYLKVRENFEGGRKTEHSDQQFSGKGKGKARAQ
ncbi:P-loop containing nucleoside triphosphate hydrolase protein [Lipomyces oligophaga]|uniref:P-loop containing nucleoside triphosphate hydrolase protein n=1 Tax=Lipomyces oligophaga TaxID=45792 RepID=UPI0034CDC34F